MPASASDSESDSDDRAPRRGKKNAADDPPPRVDDFGREVREDRRRYADGSVERLGVARGVGDRQRAVLRERDARTGDERSRDYNENIRLQTMRFAIRDMLKKKPFGMEGVVSRHFALLKPVLLRQLARWLSECKSPSNKTAMEKAYVEIVGLLEKEEAAAANAGEEGGSSAMEIS